MIFVLPYVVQKYRCLFLLGCTSRNPYPNHKGHKGVSVIGLFGNGILAQNSTGNTASETCPILNGSIMPDGNLLTLEGKPFNFREETSKTPTILIVYRGGWCPYCNRHFGELMDASGETHQRLPVPAAFVINKKGEITFSYLNPDYKTRISKELLIAAAKAAL